MGTRGLVMKRVLRDLLLMGFGFFEIFVVFECLAVEVDF